MWLCIKDKLKGKTAHFRLPSTSQKHACLNYYSTLACWIKNGYNQLSDIRPVGYLSLYIQRTLVGELLIIPLTTEELKNGSNRVGSEKKKKNTPEGSYPQWQ